MEVYGVDEGHGGGLDFMLVKQFLQIDFPDYFLAADPPVHQPTVEPASNAQLPVLVIHILYCVDYVIMSLIQQFRALQIKIIKPNVALVIADSYCPIGQIQLYK